MYNAHVGFSQQEIWFDPEGMVIGGILLEPSALAGLTLRPEHFSQTRNRLIFTAMRELEKDEIEIDIVTIAERLGSNLESAGNYSYMTDLAVNCPSAAGVSRYEKMILQKHRLNEMGKAAAGFLRSPSEAAGDQLLEALIGMEQKRAKEVQTTSSLLAEIEGDLRADKGEVSGVETGYNQLDGMTGGLQSGDLIILAARPSMGKTAFVLNLAKNACQRGTSVDLFSLEMPAKQLLQRLLSTLCQIHGSKWRNPFRYFSEREEELVSRAIRHIEDWHLRIHDKSGQSIADIRSAIQMTKQELPERKRMAIIDYLQLMDTDERQERHDLAIGRITRELKATARQLEVPIILLSQLSRSVESRNDKRPMLSDLKDSGSIEQDADLVLFLYRDDYYSRNTEETNVTECLIAKHRNGPIGTLRYHFRKETGQFTEESLAN